MSIGRRRRPGWHVSTPSDGALRPGLRCPCQPAFPPLRLVGAPAGSPPLSRPRLNGSRRPRVAASAAVTRSGPTAIVVAAHHLDALFALAYLYSRDDDKALRAVAAAIGGLGLGHDVDAGTSGKGPVGSASLWRVLADVLHAGYASGAEVEQAGGDIMRRAVCNLRREAIALHAAGFSDGHTAGLLGLSRPVVRLLLRHDCPRGSTGKVLFGVQASGGQTDSRRHVDPRHPGRCRLGEYLPPVR